MLTPAQLTAIDNHLRSHLNKLKWLHQDEFIAEITDHYIDAISERMSQGDSFDAALISIYNSFGQSPGLKQLELTYWKFSAREFRKKIVIYMLNFLSFPLVFITVPSIVLFLMVRIKFAGLFLSPFIVTRFTLFEILLYSQSLLGILAWLFKKRPTYFGPFQPWAQKIAVPLGKTYNWLLFIFCMELFSSPILLGKAAPYSTTLLYIISLLGYFSYRRAIKAYRFTA
ncbi:hypothetical protein GO755_37905 [Spirosoma sp. HMF4905]|uniref:Uncharacterized protein n=1 Tax=Spirosoma arboris TaxID=2682092 RepID=A0A7K1SQ80_9BACT|nr:hypothetical protein [Spirosoma arboris]MVM35853.1 hypothetical protein [Spirosoma arboris]